MSYADFTRRVIFALMAVTITILTLLAVSNLSSILLLVFLCWVLSIGLDALIHRLERLGIGRSIAGLLTFVGLGAIIALVFIIVIPPFLEQITDLVQSLPDAIRSLVETYADIRASLLENQSQILNQLAQALPDFTLEDYDTLLETQFDDVISQENVTSAIDFERILGSALPLLGGIGSFVGSLLANTIFILLITAYLVADPLTFYRPIIAIVPKANENRAVDIINKIHRDVIAWMSGLTVSIAFTSISVTLALGVLLNIPNAVALGVLAGLGTFIPNLGYYVGLIPILIFTAADDPAKVIPAGVLFWGLNQFEASVVTPAVMKNELNIPAGIIIPFQLIAAAVMGFYGIILSVPMLAIIITLVREIYVFDVLGKRDELPTIYEDEFGQVVLESGQKPKEGQHVEEDQEQTEATADTRRVHRVDPAGGGDSPPA